MTNDDIDDLLSRNYSMGDNRDLNENGNVGEGRLIDDVYVEIGDTARVDCPECCRENSFYITITHFGLGIFTGDGHCVRCGWSDYYKGNTDD